MAAATALFTGRGSIASRVEAGKAARKKTPRKALAEFKPSKRDPIALLEASNAGRVPELIPIRYGRMVASPFAFYRGAAPLMADDLAQQPNSKVIVQLCGDAHLANFGLFASPERRILFGLNDFDETLPGPFDWDIKRLAASFVIAARERGFMSRRQREVVRILCASWRQQIAHFSGMDTLDVWYHQFSADGMLAMASSVSQRKKEQATIRKAMNRTSRDMATQSTETVNGKLRIRDVPPLTYHYRAKNRGDASKFDTGVRQLFSAYRETLSEDRRVLFDRYELVDAAVRVVGVGSVGTRCYVALFMADGESPLFLQVKEARASVLENYLPKSEFANHGQRVVIGQHLIQSSSDIFLGWAEPKVTGFDFYVRQLRDMKGSFDFESFELPDLKAYAESCGYALARAMGKAADPALIHGYVGKSTEFDQAIEDFAVAYAEQNEADWSVLKAAVKAGRVKAALET
jgi:uncharacterized protein (DUF2252 family)